jgi:bacterioferritin-associated ferredoxin
LTIILIRNYDAPIAHPSVSLKIMYVCICHSVTDGEIREAVERGAGSLYEVQCQLPVAAGCGRCEEFACALVEEHLQRVRVAEKKVA